MIIGAFALVVGLTLYTLLDALRTHQDQMRTFPKWLWIIAVIFFPVVGPLLWLLLGRPRAVRAPKTQQGGGKSTCAGSRRKPTVSADLAKRMRAPVLRTTARVNVLTARMTGSVRKVVQNRF